MNGRPEMGREVRIHSRPLQRLRQGLLSIESCRRAFPMSAPGEKLPVQ